MNVHARGQKAQIVKDALRRFQHLPLMTIARHILNTNGVYFDVLHGVGRKQGLARILIEDDDMGACLGVVDRQTAYHCAVLTVNLVSENHGFP